MKYTAMWKEIHEQPEVAKIVLETYMPKSEYFRDLLSDKKQIIVTGMGASLYAAYMAKYVFLHYCSLIPRIIPADELPYLLDKMDKDTLILFISQSGESYETKVIGEMLKEKGIVFWGMTNDSESWLAHNAAEVLFLHSGLEISSATKTNLASYLILCIIASGYDKAVKKILKEIPEKLRDTLIRAEKATDIAAEQLEKAEHAYILGLGANAATAVQGALLLQEKAFIHAGGSSVSDFRHGTVEVTEKGLPIILVASGKAYTEIALQHGKFLKEIGAVVYLITDHPEANNILDQKHIIQVPVCPIEEFSSAVCLMPLQLLAEMTARKKGLEVDGFRHLSKVVGEYGGK